MTDKRFEVKVDAFNECITVTDTHDKLRNGFDSDFMLAPAEDGRVIVDELNVQCSIVDMLVEQLMSYEDEEDIQYWIDRVREEV